MGELIEKLKSIEELLNLQYILKKEILDSEEASKYLKITQDNLYRLNSNGVIPSYRPNGRFVYYKISDLNDWLLHKKNNSKEKVMEEKVNDFFSPKTKKIIR